MLVTLALGSEAQELPSAPSESVLVRRVVWPVVVRPTRGAAPGACEALGPADLIVTEDGVPRPVTDISRRPQRALHALLIDASLSMRTNDRLVHARQAAARYLTQLPRDEPVLVAEFDDSLRLVAPPTHDRARLAAAIESIRPGNGTALWDALYDLLGYLESFPGTKTLVLLTDGEDSTSLLPEGRATVLARAGAAPAVSVFPLALDLSSHSRAERYRALLRELADTTGGLYFEARGVAVLDPTFEALRLHLERRWFVTYEPLQLGLGPRDAGDADPRMRRVRVRPRPGLPCRVVASARRERAESGAAAAASWVRASAGGPFALELRRPERYAWAGALEAPALHADGPAERLLVHTPDLVLERGALWRRGPYERTGRLSATVDRKPQVAERDVRVEVPDLAHVQSEIRGPEDVLLHLLRCGPGAHAESFVHGRTLLELREPIARALYELRPDYRSWARERLVEDALPEIDAVFADVRRRHAAVGAVVLAQVRAAMLERAAEPDGTSPERFLAEWIGDVAAREVASRLEGKLAAAVLSSAPSSAALRETARALAGRGWDAVLDVLPPATGARVLAPLVPAWDPERRAVGFYRFVLPRPKLDGPPDDPVPRRPLGLEAALWLAGRREFVGVIEGLGVPAIDHPAEGTARRRALVRALRDAFRDAEGERPEIESVVAVTLADAEVEGARLKFLAARAADGAGWLFAGACVDGTVSARIERARKALVALDNYRPLDCTSEALPATSLR